MMREGGKGKKRVREGGQETRQAKTSGLLEQTRQGESGDMNQRRRSRRGVAQTTAGCVVPMLQGIDLPQVRQPTAVLPVKEC